MPTTANLANGEPLPVYLPFATFRAAVQNLRAHGLPEELDRSAWNRSGAEQGQIISAFKFLGLTDLSQNTQSVLKKLVAAREDSPEEKQILSQLLREHYGKLFAIDLATATPKQIADAIGAYGVTGATKERAVRFFLKAARHCGIALSSRLTGGMRARVNTSASEDDSSEEPTVKTHVARTTRRRRNSLPQSPPPAANQAPACSAMKIIRLPGVGGTLTISGTFNPFGLIRAERDLVYKIIDLMNEFEQNTETAKE